MRIVKLQTMHISRVVSLLVETKIDIETETETEPHG